MARTKQDCTPDLTCVLLLDNRSGCFNSQYPSEAVRHPSSFIIKANLSVKSQKIMIATDDIESNAVLKLAEANRAKVNRSGITFFQMIRTAKYTLKVYTML